MINDDLLVLHLSDLHIKNESEKGHHYSNSLKRLIKDVSGQVEDKENIILVVSGDIIDRGDYISNEKTAINFFMDLHKEVKSKIIDIQIVPGNHDKERSRINTLVSIAHKTEGLKPEPEEGGIEWETQLEAFDAFIKLVNKIYEIFEKNSKITNTFGAEVIEINNNNVCFLRIDTAWCSCSDNDNRQLRISEYQLKSIYNDYKEIRNNCESIAITIAISHHPLSWLYVEEEELCNNYFLANDFLDVDILMCGHVHDFSVINYFNHEHSLLTLVTGIGWGTTKPNEAYTRHRYSLYEMNLLYNSCEIIMRKTNNNNRFDYDYSVYAGEFEINDNKLRYPIKVKESHAFIRLNAPSPINVKSLYVDNQVLEKIPILSYSLAKISDNIARLYSRYIQDFIDYFEEKFKDCYSDITNKKDVLLNYFYEDKPLSVKQVEDWFKKDESSYERFLAFLNEICISIVEELKDCFSEHTKIRAHFRWHNNHNKEDSYHMLCQYRNLSTEQRTKKMQLISWGGLIKSAFETKLPIIFSANKNLNIIDTMWDDFITVIPQFNNYAHDIRINKGRNEARPMLTFGISIKNEQEQEKSNSLILYLLGFLRIDLTLSQMIDEYVRLFNVNVKNFLSHIQNIKDNLDKEEHNNV